METLDKNKLPEKNKEQLLIDQERLKSEMEYQFDGIKEDAADVGKTVLMVGGTLFLGYKLFRFVTRDKRKKKVNLHASGRPVVVRHEEKVSPTFGSLLTQQLMTVAVFILAQQIKSRLK